jgi:integrase
MRSQHKSQNVGWSTAAEDLLAYYRTYGTRNSEEAGSRVTQLTAYFKGWRLSSEVLTLTRRQVDLSEGTLRLEPDMGKNREAKVAYLTPELKAGIAKQLARVKDLERRTGAIVSWLFPYLGAGTLASVSGHFANAG